MPPGTKVLVIEDSLDTAHTLSYLLRDSGYEVEYAINGHSALAIAERMKPDVVLLDLSLPDFDGFTLARRLRRLPEHKARIIAFTGRVGDDDERNAVAAGCERLLRKPLAPQMVEKLIEQQDVPAASVHQLQAKRHSG
jgi:CheY-like chemotaxis protein